METLPQFRDSHIHVSTQVKCIQMQLNLPDKTYSITFLKVETSYELFIGSVKTVSFYKRSCL